MLENRTDVDDVDGAAAPVKRPLGRYIIGLALIAVLAIVSSVLNNRALARQSHDAAIVAIASNQTVLSQRITEAAGEVALLPDDMDRSRPAANLQAARAEMRRAHHGLQLGDPSLGLPGGNSPEISSLMTVADRHYRLVDGGLTAFQEELASGSGDLNATVVQLERDADLFEVAMGSVAARFQSEAEQRVEELRQTQYILLSATLILLLLEGLFLFRPAAKAMRTSFREHEEARVEERKASQQRLTMLAEYDPLTGLINRTLFADRLRSAIARARREGNLVSLMFLDIDHFKTVNDRFGHATGDALLKHVAARLVDAVRESDTVARLGGDEFTVILEGNHRVEDAGSVATKILRTMEQPFRVGHRELYVSASIGIAVYPMDGEDAPELLKDADIAMYSAKAAGRNTYQYFTAELRDQTAERLHLIDGLRQAIEHEGTELRLEYQPKVSVASRDIVPIGDWVLRQATTQAQAWINDGLAPIPVSVNVASRQFRQGDLVESVVAALDSSGLDPTLLELELTEGTLVDDTELARRTLERLREMGVRVSIDDFGTGYSSLSYLKRFPIDTLKIDRSFIAEVTEDQDDAAISTAIVGLAKSLRLDVIAEGVETLAQLAFLEGIGCGRVQGYLFSRPLTPEMLVEFVTAAPSNSRAATG